MTTGKEEKITVENEVEKIGRDKKGLRRETDPSMAKVRSGAKPGEKGLSTEGTLTAGGRNRGLTTMGEAG